MMKNSTFTDINTVIQFKSQYWIDGKRTLLLWPVWAYRVVAPEFSNPSINIFQKMILGMFRVGVTTIAEVNDHLDLGRDLVAFIFSELQMKGFLHSDGRLTEKGIDYYHDESIAETNQIVGYVFQDPFSGNLWNRFSVDPYSNIIEADNCPDSPGLMLEVGSTGRPHKKYGFRVLPPSNVVPTTPTSREILYTIQKYKFTLKNKNKALRHNNIEVNSEVNYEAPHLSAVSVIEDEPTPMFLVSAVHIKEEKDSNTGWFGTDPFGLGESWDMRRIIQNVMQDDHHLQKYIRNFIGDEIADGAEDYDSFMKNIEEDAVISLEERFSGKIKDIPGLFESLVMLISRHTLFKNSTRKSSMLLEDLMRASSEPLESILAHIIDRYPISIPILDKILSKDITHNKSIYNSIAESYGYTVPLPKRISSVKPGKVFGVIAYNTSTLRPITLLGLVATRQHEDHPLRYIGERRPDLFELIESISVNRDDKSHFSRAGAASVDVEKQIENVYSVIDAMLEQIT
jgi:hypothetical protein